MGNEWVEPTDEKREQVTGHLVDRRLIMICSWNLRGYPCIETLESYVVRIFR